MLKVEIRPPLRDLRGRYAAMKDRLLVEEWMVHGHAAGEVMAAAYKTSAPKASGVLSESFSSHLVEAPFGFNLSIETNEPDRARYLREGHGPIEGNPVLAFFWVNAPITSSRSDGMFFFRRIGPVAPNLWEEQAKIEAMPIVDAMMHSIGGTVARKLAHGIEF